LTSFKQSPYISFLTSLIFINNGNFYFPLHLRRATERRIWLAMAKLIAIKTKVGNTR